MLGSEIDPAIDEDLQDYVARRKLEFCSVQRTLTIKLEITLCACHIWHLT